MKTLLKIFALFGFAAIVISISSCSAGLPSGDVQTNKDLFVDMGSYSVSYPVGDDWSCETDRVNNAIRFTRQRVISGMVVQTTSIEIFVNQIKADTVPIVEKETADNYRNNELKIMQEEGVKKGKIVLDEIQMFEKVFKGRKYYCMSYTTDMGSFLDGKTMESMLALYFPSEVNEKHEFYVFLINDMKISGTIWDIDATQIYPVLKSFSPR